MSAIENCGTTAPGCGTAGQFCGTVLRNAGRLASMYGVVGYIVWSFRLPSHAVNVRMRSTPSEKMADPSQSPVLDVVFWQSFCYQVGERAVLDKMPQLDAEITSLTK